MIHDATAESGLSAGLLKVKEQPFVELIKEARKNPVKPEKAVAFFGDLGTKVSQASLPDMTGWEACLTNLSKLSGSKILNYALAAYPDEVDISECSQKTLEREYDKSLELAESAANAGNLPLALYNLSNALKLGEFNNETG